jgi:hypothetical protein
MLNSLMSVAVLLLAGVRLGAPQPVTQPLAPAALTPLTPIRSACPVPHASLPRAPRVASTNHPPTPAPTSLVARPRATHGCDAACLPVHQ